MNQNEDKRKDLQAEIAKLSRLLAATAIQSKIVDDLIKTENAPTGKDEGFESATEGTYTPPTTPAKSNKGRSSQEISTTDRFGEAIHEGDCVKFLTPSKYGITEATVTSISEDREELRVKNGRIRTWKKPNNVKVINKNKRK